ncbi:ATP-dependent helicase [Ensifer sp. Root127]|nr:ATP-dependent helicase [Ensifer sp. Root127]
MTSLQRSAFDLLAPPVQRWIWQQKWQSLRDVQEKAIPAVLAGGDVVISAKTAAGKTEAAILPLLTRVIASNRESGGFAVLYVSPLKALINDQHRRLEAVCEACDILVHKWHGDVAAEAKARARRRPSGVILVTPESLEAMLVRRGSETAYLFSALQAVVVDELHAFIGTERGMQLQSILNRIEVECGRERIDRIGLSATLGDMHLAAEALRPGGGEKVRLIDGNDQGNGIRLQIRGYSLGAQRPDDTQTEAVRDDVNRGGEDFGIPSPMADDLFRFLRGSRNLLFAGSRQRVEVCSDLLRGMCEEQRLSNEFYPHHGSLSKSEREEVEVRLRDDPRPTTAVATTTLELGIDIGSVESVAQIGPGFSVASLRQRLGRSGRREGNPAILRVFVAELAADRGTHPVDRLKLDLVQAIAMVECLRMGWCEPPIPRGLHLSTLIHQILALIMQTGGIRPAAAYKVLCERGPFRLVDRGMFAEVLRCMASAETTLIEQAPDGLLLIGKTGEFLTESHEFYPVFATEREYRIIHESRVLGTYPLDSLLAKGETLIFAGRRWKILEIDDVARVITVRPATYGKPPYFPGSGGLIHDRIISMMRDILTTSDEYAYIDRAATAMLQSAREAYHALGLDRSSVVRFGSGVMLFPWVGTRKLGTLALACQAREFETAQYSHVIELQDCDLSSVESFLDGIANGDVPDERVMAARLAQPNLARFDHFLTPELMWSVTLRERLDLDALPELAKSLVSS